MTSFGIRPRSPRNQRVPLIGGPLHGLTRAVNRDQPFAYFQVPEGQRRYRYVRDEQHRFVYAPEETT